MEDTRVVYVYAHECPGNNKFAMNNFHIQGPETSLITNGPRYMNIPKILSENTLP
jgi:hypothetical protein